MEDSSARLEEKSRVPLGSPTPSTSSLHTPSPQPAGTYVVTGGSGFVGSHLVENLLLSGNHVLVLDNKMPPNDILCRLDLAERSQFILCDITRYNDVYRAFNVLKKEKKSAEKLRSNSLQSLSSNHTNNGSVSLTASSEHHSGCHIDCVFHCAALTDQWAPPSLYEKVNVGGTENVIRACHECNITRLVYTSSSGVVLDGTDCQNGDESMKYVAKKNHLNAYSYSKHRAEEKVLSANATLCVDDQSILLTTALRPHLIFGPRDTHFISQLLSKARAGKITHMIGEGHNITDFTFIDNIVAAHLLAAKGLDPARHPAAGQVYFVTNGEPTLFWSFLGAMLQQLGCPRPTKYISYNVAYAIALIMEFIHSVIGWLFGWKPIITRQMVATMALHHWFSHAKATRDLGYRPRVTLDEGIKKTVQWIQWNHRRRRHGGLSGSESSESLGSLKSDFSAHSRHRNENGNVPTSNGQWRGNGNGNGNGLHHRNGNSSKENVDLNNQSPGGVGPAKNAENATAGGHKKQRVKGADFVRRIEVRENEIVEID